MRRALSAAAAAVLILACGREDEVPEVPLRPVTLVRVEAVDLVDRIEATGQLIPEDSAAIAAEVAGRVTGIRIDEGEAAGEGDVVLDIDPERRALERDRARAQLDQAQATLREQEREYKRIQELHGRNVASERQLDAVVAQLELARSRVDAARAELRVAERALEDASVKAPFAGLIAKRLVSTGEYVAQAQPLFELVALDPIQVEFHVNEVDSGRVRRGQRVDVRVAPYPGEVFQAKVDVVSPTIDETSRTLRLKATMENADGRLRPGLFARVDLGVATRNGVAMVPEEAVLQRADGAVVFVTDGDNRVKRLTVETGVHRGGTVEIVSGVSPGQMVVTRGHADLEDGDVVDPRTPGGDPIGASIPDVATQ